MANRSKIEWTHRPGTVGRTWNPVVGCSKVSPGCDHCYAERQSARLQHLPAYARTVNRKWIHGEEGGWTGKVRCLPERVDDPLHWKPSTVFVCSMSDLFHSQVPWEFIVKVFNTMAGTPWHTYQVLTKRPGNMAAFAEWWTDLRCREWPPWIWAGTSLEQMEVRSGDYVKRLTGRLDCLARVPAPVRFVSAEPMLGPVNLTKWLAAGSQCEADRVLDWVICGGESGPGARPMHPDWPRDLKDQCQAAGVPFFFKQWGEWLPVSQMETDFWKGTLNGDVRAPNTAIVDENGQMLNQWPGAYEQWRPRVMARVGKKTAGALLDGREWREWPEEKLKEAYHVPTYTK